MEEEGVEIDPADIFRIMIATDSHLGYNEKDVVRGEDSFIAFEEMLQMAVSEDVDFILLAGDLFHDATPSQNTLHRCMQLLRRYTFGDKPIALEVLSDQTMTFHNAINKSVNYEDPNLNISIPVFSIHGNHDDPTGLARLSSLDLLSTTGLVNYFGRWTNLKKVEISPILLRKGKSLLALYGLSHIRDSRLSRLFENHKVTMNCPIEKENEWFNLMVVHQNRANRGPKNYLPEEMLPAFLNLVVWGHEHDCRITPEYNHKRDFYVTQPGSSVPTSLAEGESLKKHVGLLQIYQNKFQLKSLPLQTVRPFLFESINLANYVKKLKLDEGDASTKVTEFARQKVEEMIERSKDLLTGHPDQPKLPLIRLRFLFNDESQMFNTIRFSQMFSDRVANCDIVLFKRINKIKESGDYFDKDAIHNAFEKMDIDNTARVEELVDRYFEEVKDKKLLKILTPKALTEMTFRIVDRGDVNAAENIIKYCKDKAVEHLIQTRARDENIECELSTAQNNLNIDGILEMLDKRTSKINKGAQGEEPTDKKTNSANSPKKSVASKAARARERIPITRVNMKSGASVHAMPQLDVTINSKRCSARQHSSVSNVRGAKKKSIYVISDDSD